MRHLQIAICDDDNGACSQLETWILEYQDDNGVKIDIDIYNTAEELFASLKDGKWVDIIFFDIELPGLSGLQVGRGIREKLGNDIVNIVFISGKTCYCKDLFDIQPLNFHEKPLKKLDIFQDLDKFVKKYNIFKLTYSFRQDGIEKGVPLAEIMYFSVYKKTINLVTINGTYTFRGYLGDVEKEIPEALFCRCHKSFIVNINYVKMFKYNEFLMSDGNTIPVGRNYREKVKQCQITMELR